MPGEDTLSIEASVGPLLTGWMLRKGETVDCMVVTQCYLLLKLVSLLDHKHVLLLKLPLHSLRAIQGSSWGNERAVRDDVEGQGGTKKSPASP